MGISGLQHTALGLPLLLLGAFNDDNSLVVIGAVLLGLFIIDTAFVFPVLVARRSRRR